MGLAECFVFTLIGLVAVVLLRNPAILHLPLGRGKDAFLERLGRMRIWHLAFAAAVMALALSFLDRGAVRSGVPQFLVVAAVVVLFAVGWVREFFFLMALRDEALPGRYDKPIWASVLIVLGPIGLFLFRAYRLAHWPEPKPVADPARELA